MTTIKAFITRHPVPAYFVLTFAISWGGVLLVIGGPGGIPGGTAQNDPLFPFVVLAMLAGPSVAGILLTGLIDGRAGLREFRSRLLKWRVGARWYAAALLAAPLLMTATLLALSFTSRVSPRHIHVTRQGAVLLFGIAVGLAAGFFEELGWTGFAVPGLNNVTASLLPDSSWECCGERGISWWSSGESAAPPARSLWPSSCRWTSCRACRPTGC